MWADWIEAVLTRAGFRVLPRSTVLTAPMERRRPRSIQAEHELQGAPRAIAVLSSAYMHSPQGQVDLEDAVVGRRRRHAPAADPDPGQRGQDHRAVQRAPGRGPGADGRGPGDRETAVGPGPAGAAAGSDRGGQAEEPRFPARSRRSGTCPPGTPTSPAAAPRWNCCATSWPAAAGRSWSPRRCTGWAAWARPSSRWSTRTASWPTTTWSGGCRRSGPRRSAGRSPTWPARWACKVGDNVAEAAEAALEELRRDTTPHWLLIFDNADDPKQLEPYLPTGSGHVLITSRNQAWTHSAEPLEVDVFTRDESVGHLLRHVPELDLADAQAGRRRPGPSAAGGRAGQRVAGADRDAGPGLRRAAGDPVHPDPGPEPAAGLPDAGGGDVEPVLRPAEAAIAGGGPAAADAARSARRARSRWTCSTATR